jgi:hypothetical protein
MSLPEKIEIIQPPIPETETVGYITQELFSCRTCYEDQIKDLLLNFDSVIATKKGMSEEMKAVIKEESLKFRVMGLEEQDEFLMSISNIDIRDKYQILPHGFCVGCMLKCHEGHLVYELYTKADFRCDCGTNRMPESCQWVEEKDFDNEGNKYGQNFYDIYCFCHRPHDQDLMENDKVIEDFFLNVLDDFKDFKRTL